VSRVEITEEIIRMRTILVELISVDGPGGKLPRLEDGAIDVFAVVRKKKIDAKQFAQLTRGRRGGKGVSTAEIAKNDYGNFPYRRGGRWCTLMDLRNPPVLWEKEPDANGKLVVGYANGAAKYVDAKELKRFLEELEKGR
jgi:hypothetical protein